MDSRHTLLRRLASVAFAVMLSVGTAGAAIASEVPEPDRIAFGQVGIAFGQSVELTIVNAGPQIPAGAFVPTSDLQILDQNGNVLARLVQQVAPGQSATLKLNGDTIRRVSNRLHLRGLVEPCIFPPDASMTTAMQMIATFEVVDNIIGRTAFVLQSAPYTESSPPAR